MHIKQTACDVRVEAPAKVNLFLEVLGKRPDGFHELETLMVPVRVFDTLIFRPRSDDQIQLTCEWAPGLVGSGKSAGGENPYGDLPTDDKNIVMRGAKLLRLRSGKPLGADISVIKRIPSSAGLGGASGDAAATLLAGNAAWNLGLSPNALWELASELGSDVPFFLGEGGAVCRGRGEKIEAAPTQQLHVVIVRPPVGLGTPQVFSRCKPAETPWSLATISAGLSAGNPQAIRQGLVNRLEAPAAQITPWIQTLRQAFEGVGAFAHQMSGSGSSYFGLFYHARQAKRTANWLRSQRLGLVYDAATMVF